MKRIISLCLISLLCLSLSAQKTYAVITGVSNYEGTVNDLTQSSKDAKNLSTLYKSKGAHVTLLTSKYATREKVIETIRKIASVAKPTDHIVFSYSGHGMPNMLCTYSENQSPMLSYSELFTELDKCQAADIVCYVDACFSGTASSNLYSKDFSDDSWKNIIKANPHYVLFLSSRDDELSIESPLVGAGFFTRSILKGLRGKSDVNGDRQVTVKELFTYLYKDVQLHSNKKQHPQLVTSSTLHDTVLMSWQ